MNSQNPYSPTSVPGSEKSAIRRVEVRPIELLKRGYALIADEYWTFFGITLVGVLIGSLVPMGILLGAMLVGIYLCYLQKERGQPVEFATLFRGFDTFLDSFLVILAYLAASLVVIGPCMLVLFAIILVPVITASGAGNPPPEPPVALIFAFYPVILLANFVIVLPFVFSFQLIADRGLKAKAAIKVSMRGVKKNLGGVIWFLFVLGILSIVGTMLCYVPALLLMPISFAAMFTLYRDIFGRDAVNSDVVATPQG